MTHSWPWKTLPRKILVSQRFPASRVKGNMVPDRRDSVTPCCSHQCPEPRWSTAVWTSPWWQPALPQGAWCGHSRHRPLSAATSHRMFLTSSKTSSLFLKRTKWILFGTPFCGSYCRRNERNFFSTEHCKEKVFKTILEVWFKLI